MMKKLFKLSLIAGLALSAAACSDKETKSASVVQNDNHKLVEGVDYKKVNIAGTHAVLPVKEDGKPLVVEIFNYGCGSCARMEPLLDPILNKYEGEITRVKISAPFQQWLPYSALFTTLDKMGYATKMSPDIFKLIHDENQRNLVLDSEPLNKLLDKYGVDKIKFKEIYTDPDMVKEFEKSLQILNIYAVDSTPTIIINNEMMFSPSINKGFEESAETVEKAIKLQIQEEKKLKEENNKSVNQDVQNTSATETEKK